MNCISQICCFHVALISCLAIIRVYHIFVSISTCALREEGDTEHHPAAGKHQYFYPRPPRGGRPCEGCSGCRSPAISIHALREEGDLTAWTLQCPAAISIHALREEGDTQAIVAARKIERFLSTPSARRATIWPIMLVAVASFLSTPSARRATCEAFFLRRQLCISIHALREEGDPRTPAAWCVPLTISIHALREEGDTQAIVAARKIERFLSTPSARRATIWPIMLVAVASFLSTPSARRATCEAFFLRRQLCISIHALREEGDCTF